MSTRRGLRNECVEPCNVIQVSCLYQGFFFFFFTHSLYERPRVTFLHQKMKRERESRCEGEGTISPKSC